MVALEIELTANSLSTVAAGLAMLGLAGALLYVNHRHRLNRAFALFLVIRGFSNLLMPVVRPLDGAQEVATLGGAVDLLLVFPALHFGLAYRQAEHDARYPPWIPWALVAGALASFLIWLVAPEAGPVQVGRPTEVFRIGPLIAINSLAYVTTLAVIGVLLARDAVRAGTETVRASSFLLSVAFLAWPVYLGLFQSLENLGGDLSVSAIGRYSEAPPAIETIAAPLFILCWLAGVATVVYVYRAAQADGSLLRPARLVASGLLLVALAALLPYQLALLEVGSVAGRASLSWVLQGIALLVMPLLGFYALVRHQVFGVDLKIKIAVRQSTVAAVFVGVFFVVSEGAQELFADQWGPLLGIAAAGGLVFILAPLQRAAERLANAAMPGVPTTEELDTEGLGSIYRDQVRFAWADGVLTEDERAMLNGLRERLELSRSEAARIEDEVVGS